MDYLDPMSGSEPPDRTAWPTSYAPSQGGARPGAPRPTASGQQAHGVIDTGTAEVRQPRELVALAALEADLMRAVPGYSAHVSDVRDLVGSAVSRRADISQDDSSWSYWSLFVLTIALALVADHWFDAHYLSFSRSKKESSLINVFAFHAFHGRWYQVHILWFDFLFLWMGILGAYFLVFLLIEATIDSPPRVVRTRRITVVAAVALAVGLAMRWRGGHPGYWGLVMIGAGLVTVPAEIEVSLRRRHQEAARVKPQEWQLQVLSRDLVHLLDLVHRAARDREWPPAELVAELEACARRAETAAEQAARGWPRGEREVRSWVRESGRSVAAGFRWHKGLVAMPTASASADLFASFGGALVAAAGLDWQRLMFAPAPSPVRSFWHRYRGRLAVTAVLMVASGASFAFPAALPTADLAQIRGFLVLTTLFSLFASSSNTLGRAYDVVGSIISHGRD